MQRQPVVANRFYPGSRRELAAVLQDLFPTYALTDKPSLVMVPHAGYIFSAATAAEALAGLRLPKTVVILCPNHTGMGTSPFGVWPEGDWLTPLGSVPVDAKMADALCSADVFSKDEPAHMQEHSIEVVLPFLQYMAGDCVPQIVPICVSTQNPAYISLAASVLAEKAGNGLRDGSILLIASSDMNHYEDEETTQIKDRRALECVLAQDADELLARCRAEHITMCGAAPMALALKTLAIVRGDKAPSRPARLTGHTTSGRAAHDYEHVVGYAGVRVYL